MSEAGGVVLPAIGNALQQIGQVLQNMPNQQLHGVGHMLEGMGAEIGTTGSVIDGYTDGNSDAAIAIGIAVGAIADVLAADAAASALILAGPEAMLLYGVLAATNPFGAALLLAAGATLVGVGVGMATDAALKRFLPELFRRDPLVIDLDGDGVKLTAVGLSNAFFDLNGDGFAEKTGWVSPQDGLLVIDNNQNGIIDDITELFGSESEDGFTSLARLDANADGLISAADAQFDQLRVWQDVNGNGITDTGELMTLSAAGVDHIGLANTQTNVDNAGNLVIRQGESYRADGTTLATAAVAFTVDQVNTRFILPEGFVLNPEVFDLPNLKGFGRVPDLWIAMSLNSDLLDKVRDLVGKGAFLKDFKTIVGQAYSADQSFATLGTASGVNGPYMPAYLAGDFDHMLEEWAGTVEVPDDNIFNPTLISAWTDGGGSGGGSGGGVVLVVSEGLKLVSRVVGGFLNQRISDFAFGNAGYYREFERFSSEMALRFFAQVPHAAEQQLAMTIAQGIAQLLEAGASPSGAQMVAVIQDALSQREDNPTTSAFVNALGAISFVPGNNDITGDVQSVLSLLTHSFNFRADHVREDYETWRLTNRGLLSALQASDAAVFGALRGRTGNAFQPILLGDYTKHLGASGNDILDGAPQVANELFVASAGTDQLNGRDGNDTYAFRDLFGNTTVTDTGGSGDEIAFSNGRKLADATISFANGGHDLILDFGATGRLTVVDYLDAAGAATIEVISFSDGSSFDPRMLRDLYLRSLATAGDDAIRGWERAGTLQGFEGNDSLKARNGDDVLIGGTGNDFLSGGGGNDVYRFDRGDGNDTIVDGVDRWDGGEGGNDRIELGIGISAIDITISQQANGNDLLLTIAGGDSIYISGEVTNGANFVEQLVFADGTIWDRTEMFNRSIIATEGADRFYGTHDGETIAGAGGDDWISARNGDDIVVGGTGNDYLAGGGGNDVYRFARGDGQDTIVEGSTDRWDGGWGGYDRIELGEGITVGDVTVTRLANSNDFKLDFGQGDGIYIGGSPILNGEQTIEEVAFADGTVWTHADLLERSRGETDGNDTIYGTNGSETITPGAGDDWISARYGDDVITGGTGNDYLAGGGGNDVYRFARGDGQDTIVEGSTDRWDGGWGGEDRIELGAGITVGDVTVTRLANGNDFKLDFGQGDGIYVGGSPILNGDQTVEQLIFADGTVWTMADLLERSRGGTDGNDTIYGTNGSETITSGAGDDWVNARYGDDVIAGGVGNDYLAGGGGNDVYRFERGDGQDTIVEGGTDRWDGGWGGEDRIEFGAGINAEDVTVSQQENGNDLLLTVAGGDSIYIGGAPITNGAQTIEQVAFADGTIWTMADLLQRSSGATPGNDTIYGTHGNEAIVGGGGNDWISARYGDDVVIGGTGDDYLSGGGGNDVYRFARGDGNDSIVDGHDRWDGGWGGYDRIELGEGITVGDVTVVRYGAGNDLRLDFGQNDSIYIGGSPILNGEQTIEDVAFADGTVWTHADLLERSRGETDGNDTIYGTNGNETVTPGAGNDWVSARYGDDVVIGGTGDDYLSGGGGNDVYRFARGDGNDSIVDGHDRWDGGWGGYDRIELGEGITVGDVTVVRYGAGNDLRLDFGQNDSIYIGGSPILNGEQTIEEVAFADGTVWTHADLLERSRGETDGNDTIYGTNVSETITPGAGDDWISARAGNDVLDGGIGNDTLMGDSGDDTYLFGRGDGQDVIWEWSGTTNWGEWGGFDTVEFKAGVSTDDVLVTQEGGSHIILSIIGSNDRLMLGETLVQGWNHLEQVRFADGTVWSDAELLAKSLVGTDGDDLRYGDWGANVFSGGAGNDTLLGRGGSDVLDGGGGNDALMGDSGDDTYLFGRGDGQDVIWEWSGSTSWGDWGGFDTVEFKAGVSADDVLVMQEGGSHIVLSIIGTNDRLTLGETLVQGWNHLEQVRFADGTVWSDAELAFFASTTDSADAIQGTAGADFLHGRIGDDQLNGADGADHLFGDEGDDTLTGGAGNDALVGGDGSDTAVFMGVKSDYQLSTADGVLTVTDLHPDLDGNDGVDSLTAIETLQFQDMSIHLAAPIVLDLDGNGVRLSDQSQSEARFDMDGDGSRDVTSWIDRGDALLSFDRDGDGTISGIDEISFVGDKVGATSDLDGLGAFDTNGDGLLSVDDAGFADFSVWRDRDGDGIAGKNELSSLLDAGVISIGLAGAPVSGNWKWDGGSVLNTGSFTRQDGSTGSFADVALSYQPSIAATSQAAATRLIEATAAFGILDAGLITGRRDGMDRASATELFGIRQERVASCRAAMF